MTRSDIPEMPSGAAPIPIVERVARAWASIEGRADLFDACKADPDLEATQGRYAGYLEDAGELLRRSGLGALINEMDVDQALQKCARLAGEADTEE